MTRCCVRDQNRGRALFRQVVLAEVGLTDQYLRCGAANCSSVAADSSTDLCRCDHRDDGARSCPHQETSVHVRAGVGNYPAAFHSLAEIQKTWVHTITSATAPVPPHIIDAHKPRCLGTVVTTRCQLVFMNAFAFSCLAREKSSKSRFEILTWDPLRLDISG